MSAKTDTPTTEENEDELRRILASSRFAKLPVLRPFLERLVKDRIARTAGGKGYELQLAIEVLGKDPGKWTTLRNDVRQALTNLRKQLKAYYKAEGYADKVEIGFPKGAGYLAGFSYRWATDPKETVQRLEDAFSYAFPDLKRCNRIIRELEQCVAKHPSYAPAYAVLAESILAGIACSDFLDDIENNAAPWAFAMPTALTRVEEAVNMGIGLDAQLWRLHVMTGALRCCRFEWHKADEAFKTALRLAPDETPSSFWYAAYLFAVGRTWDGITTASNWGTKSGGRLTQYISPFVRYAVRRDFSALQETLYVWNSYLMRRHSTAIEEDGQPHDENNWPTDLLMACICLALDYPYAGVRHATRGTHDSGVDAFLGLKLLVWQRLAQREPRAADSMEALFNEFDRSEQQGPVSCAMAYMASKQTEEAIKQLELACEFGHPTMIWLHFWPVFDPLREHDRFKALIKSMNLP